MNVFLLSTLIVLLPMVPAFILFKFLPESSKAEAEGPYHKLKIKLGGAFAGYFVVVLLMSGLLHGHFKPPESESAYEQWKVVGQIEIDDPMEYPLTADMFSISPPSASPGGATFEIPSLPLDLKQSNGLTPRIAVRHPDYEPEYIWLSKDSDAIKWDEENKTIRIEEPIRLRLKTNLEGQGQQANPVGPPPVNITQANVTQ